MLMKTISLRWLRRLFGKHKQSPKTFSKKRDQFRKLILEDLEPRKLMTSAPWLLPPVPPQGPSTFPGQSPLAGAPIPNLPWIPVENNFFGPREIVWISEFQPTVESGSPGYFRIERSNPLPPLQVTFNILADSTAQKNIDYQEPKSIVGFEPGVSYVDVPILAIDDTIAEGTESVRVVLWDTSRVGTWVPAHITSILISDNDFDSNTTSVELLPPTDGEEGFRDGRLRARRTGPLFEPLALPFELTLQEGLIVGQDFHIDPKRWSPKTNLGQFLFPAGETLSSVIVTVIDDSEAENTEWMNIQLLPSPLGQYGIAGKPNQTLKISDNDAKSSARKNQPRITQVALVNDTGISSTDRITWDERIEVLVEGNLSTGFLKTEFDTNGDFIPDAVETIEKTLARFQVDPGALDPDAASFIGLRSLRYRSLWYSKDQTVIDQSPWNSFDYQVIEDPNRGLLRLEDLRLRIDTGNPDDRTTSDPTCVVSILGEYPLSDSGQSRIRIEWDHTQDGIADASEVLAFNQRTAQYDPRTIDPNIARIPGPRTLRVRIVEDQTGKPLVPWQSLEFTIASPPQVPWIVTGVAHSNSPDSLRQWTLRGAVSNPSLPEGTKSSWLDPIASQLSIQIDTDKDDQPNATIPVTTNLDFEHVWENLSPGNYTIKLRVQQWSNEVNAFIPGNWVQYDFEVRSSEPPPIPIPRLRSDSGASSNDRITSDPTLLIEVRTSGPRLWISELEIDTGSKTHFISVRKSTSDNATTILFFDEAISPGLQKYRIRSIDIDPATNSRTTSDWIDFQWTYNPQTDPSMTLALLNDDDISSIDRITSIPTVVGRLISKTDTVPFELSQIQIDWNSDQTADDWTIPLQDGSFTIRPDRVPLGQRRIAARIQWTDPYRNIPLVGNWNYLDFELVAPSEQTGEISNLRLLFDTGRSDVDRISSLSTITGTVANPRPETQVQVDRNRDGIVDEEVAIDSLGRFRYSPTGLQHGTHLFHFRTIGLNDQQNALSVSPWQAFDFTYVSSTLEPLEIESLELANDSGIPQDQRSEQTAIRGRLTSLSGIGNSVVLVDLDFDRQADETITVTNDGRFVYKPQLMSAGQVSVAFQPLRIGPLQIEDNTPDRWYSFTFVYEEQPDTPPELDELRHNVNSDTLTNEISGKIRSQSDIDGMTIEIDTNGDSQPDRITKATRYADFSLKLDDLAPGDYTYRFRASAPSDSAVSMLVGSWQSISFKIANPSLQRAKITEIRLRTDDGHRDDDPGPSDPSEHDLSINQALAKLTSDRQASATENELRSQESFASRSLAMRQANSDYWTQTTAATIDLQEAQTQALTKLRQHLQSSNTAEVDLPLPDELAISWPSDTLPNLPLLISDWLPADEFMPQPPVLPLEQSVDLTVPIVIWSSNLNQAIGNEDPSGIGIDLSKDQEFQARLDQLRKELIAEQRFIGQRASMASQRARALYEIAINEAQAAYRDAMSKVDLDLKKISTEDYSDIYQQFAQSSQSALAKSQSDRRGIEDRYRGIFQGLSDAQEAQVRTAKRNRDAIFDAANRELRSILDAGQRPTAQAIKAALLRHACQTYDAQHTYDQTTLDILSAFLKESYKLQRDQSRELATVALEYNLLIAQIDHVREEALAEKKRQQSLLRASTADRFDAAVELAHHQLQRRIAQAHADLDKALILAEKDRRVGNESALRQYDFSVASAVCLTLAQRNSNLGSPESFAELQKAQQRRDLLRAWEPSQADRSLQAAELWKESALAKITAEHHKQLAELDNEYALKNHRLKATLEFRNEHARLVHSHAIELANNRLELVRANKQSEYTQQLESRLNGIDYLQGESAITQESYQKYLSAMVYTPPVLEYLTGDWIWIDNTFVASVWGSGIVPAVTGFQITRGQSIAMAQLLHQFETKRISIDQGFYNQRDSLEDAWVKCVESLTERSKANEFQLHQQYHLTVANADHSDAIAQVDREGHYDLAMARTSKDLECKSNELDLRIERLQTTAWLEYQRSIQQIEVNRIITHWDRYLRAVQKWHDAEASPWTDAVNSQAIATRNLSVRKLQIELERAREQSNRSNIDRLESLEVRLHSDSQAVSSEQEFTQDKIEARKELSRALAATKLRFATQTAGVSQLTPFGLKLARPDVPSPKLLPLKLETANTTAFADIQLAQAQLTASTSRAEAKYSHSLSLNQLGDDYFAGMLDWDQYTQRLALIDRIYYDRQQMIEAELVETSRNIDNELRSKRAEVVRMLSIEQELAKPIEAQWNWLEDVPRLTSSSQAHTELATATQVAQDLYARRMADLIVAHQEDISSNQSRRDIDLSRIHYDTIQSDNLSSESDRIALLDAQGTFRLQQLQSRSDYEKRMLQKQASDLEKIYRKLDPNTRVLIQEQAQAILLQQSSSREALAWKELSDSVAGRADQSEIMRRNRQTVDQIHQTQMQVEKETSRLNKNATVDRARFEVQWMVATQKAINAFQKTEVLVQSSYDQRSQGSLDELNRQLLEQRTQRAERIGEIWKSYYLGIHPDSGVISASLRRELDNWLGLRIQLEPLTAAAWRLQPAFDNGLMNFGKESANDSLLKGIQEVRALEATHRTESQVGFVTAIGQAKTKRIEETWDSNMQRVQSTTDADRIRAEQLHTSLMTQKNASQLLQVQSNNSKDQLELAQAQEDQAQGINSIAQANRIEKQYQLRLRQASIDYQKTWARAQGLYFVATARGKADQLQQASSEDPRSTILAAHADGYAKWIQQVASDYVDWVVAREDAQFNHSHRMMILDQERQVENKVTENNFAIENENHQRKVQRDKADLALEYSMQDLQDHYDSIQLQRQFDLEHQLLVLSGESKFLQAVEHAESTAQLMKLRRYTGFEQAREKGLLVAEAKYAQALGDSFSLKTWKERTGKLSAEVALEDQKRSQRQNIDLIRLDAQLERTLSQMDRTRTDGIALTRFEYQIDAIASSGELALEQNSADSRWRTATATARIDARKQLRQAFHGTWSEFMVAIAEHELENLENWNEVQERLIHGRAQADSLYTTTIAQAQLDAARAISLADSSMKISQGQQNLESLEQRSDAQVDFLLGIHLATNQYIDEFTTLERTYADRVATTELIFRKDFDYSTYQARLQEAKKVHEDSLNSTRMQWNQKRFEAVADLRLAKADIQKSDRMTLIARESVQAKQVRDSRRELNFKEANAYRLSDQTWASVEKEFALQTTAIESDMAMDLDCQLESTWSEFYLDIARARNESIRSRALAIESKIRKQSQQQADHEILQGSIEWAFDSGEWLASDRARQTVAQLDWSLEQISIQALRGLALASPSGDVPVAIPTPDAIDHPQSPRMDRRYDLGYVPNAWSPFGDPFSWQDTGFLAWIRSPQEQFAKSFWGIDSLSYSAERSAQKEPSEGVCIADGVLITSDQVDGMTDAIVTPTQAMVPKSPLTVDALANVDHEQLVGVVDWLDLKGRISSAAERPDYSELTLDRSLVWNPVELPQKDFEAHRESQARFFVNDQAQWNAFLRYANETYGAIHRADAKPELQAWLSKYRKHVQGGFDQTRFELISKHETSRISERYDKVFEERGVVYWKHSIGIEPSRIEGAPRMRTAKTAIGKLDSHGWVYLPSGNRVLYSALRKWADQLILANSDQASSLIDGLISPFSIDPSSKQYGIFIGGTGMHMFGVGNVERLYNLYQGTKFYYGGVGNPIEYDSIWNAYADNGCGYGWTAILDRIEADIIANYRGHQKVHIFGWSRGAAMGIEFVGRMARYGIEVEFLGLFDPVYSYVLPGQSSALVHWTPSGRAGNYVSALPKTNIEAIGTIYAANEDRSFFPATRLYPNGLTRLKMMKSPGGHGEIGGHFLSNLILQRLNMRAMVDLAQQEGGVDFDFQGIEHDLVGIFASPLTRKMQLESIGKPVTLSQGLTKGRVALGIENWRPMSDEQYYRALIDCTASQWKPGGMGFQKDNYSGLIAYSLELKWNVGEIRQTPYTHYRRNLQWCALELWDLEFLRDDKGNYILTEPHKESIRELYRLKIDPKTGDWKR